MPCPDLDWVPGHQQQPGDAMPRSRLGARSSAAARWCHAQIQTGCQVISSSQVMPCPDLDWVPGHQQQPGDAMPRSRLGARSSAAARWCHAQIQTGCQVISSQVMPCPDLARNIWLNYEGRRPEFSQNGGYAAGFAEWLRAIACHITADFVMLACCRLNF